uniref:Uncharacterized protein n=1 Tax=Romanomermis culicivorax TaxID=13658 RepID=A0A915KC38_ROMCU
MFKQAHKSPSINKTIVEICNLNGEAWLNREGVKTVACCKRAAQRVQIYFLRAFRTFFAWKVEIFDEIKFCCYSEKDTNNETQKMNR